MTIYFASAGTHSFMKDKPILESFWYKNDAKKAMQITDNFFLDSGAFSAFTQNAEINLEAYALFLRENISNITIASSLDAIGDAKKTREFYNELTINQGCDVIPVFHCREDIRYLKEYLELGVSHIALGGMVPESTTWLYGWLDDLWANYLTDNNGKSTVKVHGFGLTTISLMRRYPWFSVDSSSWTAAARWGMALINFPGKLAWIFLGKSHTTAKRLNSMHVDNLPYIEKQFVEEEFREAGVTIDQLRIGRDDLLLFNVTEFEKWEKRYGFPKTFSGSVQKSLL